MEIKFNEAFDTPYIQFQTETGKTIAHASISKDGIKMSVIDTGIFYLSNHDIKRITSIIKHFDKIRYCDWETCGNKYIPSKSHQKFCSAKCRISAHRAKM